MVRLTVLASIGRNRAGGESSGTPSDLRVFSISGVARWRIGVLKILVMSSAIFSIAVPGRGIEQ